MPFPDWWTRKTHESRAVRVISCPIFLPDLTQIFILTQGSEFPWYSHQHASLIPHSWPTHPILVSACFPNGKHWPISLSISLGYFFCFGSVNNASIWLKTGLGVPIIDPIDQPIATFSAPKGPCLNIFNK